MLQRVWRMLFHIAVPPIAGRYHGRYRGKPHYLALDTLLAAGMFLFAGLAAWALLRQTSTIFSGVQLRIDMPGTVQSGEEIHVTFRLENTAATASDLRLRVAAPERWDITEPTVRDGILWHNDSLTASASTTVPMTASVTGQSDRHYVLRATIQYTIHGTQFSSSTIAQYSVDASALTTELKLPNTAIAGQVIDGTLTIRNTTPRTINEVTVALSLPNDVRLLSTDPALDRIIRPEVGFTANQTVSSQLKLLVADVPTDRSLDITATTFLRKIPQTADMKTVSVLRQTVSDVSLDADVVYWSNAGIQFGYGPLPPKVGERTGYRVFWTVKAGTHALAQGIVRATLPASVTWQNNATATSGDQPNYSVSGRTVEWQFQRVAAAEQISASFDVSVEPVPSDRGKTLMLLDPSTLTATFDNGANIASTIGGIWNVLTDPGAEDSGKVVP